MRLTKATYRVIDAQPVLVLRLEDPSATVHVLREDVGKSLLRGIAGVFLVGGEELPLPRFVAPNGQEMQGVWTDPVVWKLAKRFYRNSFADGEVLFAA